MPIGYKHHRNAIQFSEEFIVDKLEVTTSPVRVKVGDEELQGRKLVGIVNDSSNLVYVNFVKDFSVSGGAAVTMQSGEEFTFPMDPNEIQKLWIKTDELDTTIRVYEVK